MQSLMDKSLKLVKFYPEMLRSKHVQLRQLDKCIR